MSLRIRQSPCGFLNSCLIVDLRSRQKGVQPALHQKAKYLILEIIWRGALLFCPIPQKNTIADVSSVN